MLCAASVLLPMGSKSTFLPVACSNVSVTKIMLETDKARASKVLTWDRSTLACEIWLDVEDALNCLGSGGKVPVLGIICQTSACNEFDS